MTLHDAFAQWTGLPPEGTPSGRFVSYERQGRLAAVAHLRGSEIHFAVAPEFRRRIISRRSIREFLQPLLAERTYLTTRAAPGSDTTFIDRLGFVQTCRGAIDEIRHYMLTHVPYRKEH